MDIPEIGLGCANLMKASLPELIEVAARHGFRTVTMRPLAVVVALKEGATEKTLRRHLADAGVRVTMIDCLHKGLPGRPPVETINPAFQAFYPPGVPYPLDQETCFHAAEAVGADVVNLNHYQGNAVPLDEMAAAVGQVCRNARAHGLQIALEFIHETGLPSLPFAQAVSESCGEPNCGIVLDFFHLDRSGGTVEDIRRLPPGIIANIQISDRTPPVPGSAYVPLTGRLMPGEGKLPLRALMKAAFENSPDATADIEVLNDELRALSMDETAARLAAVSKAWRATL